MTVKTEERHAQLELCIPYVFGRLNPGNRKQFEAHLTTGCEVCSKELSGLYDATALLPLLLRQEAPAAGLKQRAISRASSRKVEPARAERTPAQRTEVVTPATRPERSWYSSATIIFGLLIIVALAIFVYDLVGTVGMQEKQIAELRDKAQQGDEMLALLKSPRLEIIPLRGIEPGSSFNGKILWDTSSQNALIQVGGVPAAPEGKAYQLWMMKENKYFSIGEFQVDSTDGSIFKTLTLPAGERQQIEGFTLTLEPTGGSAQPTGTIFLRGVK